MGKIKIRGPFGYLSVDGCAHRVWELEAKVNHLAVNEQAQANALDALFETYWSEKYGAGGFLWKWFPIWKAMKDAPQRIILRKEN